MNKSLRQSSRRLVTAVIVALVGTLAPAVASAAETEGAAALYWSNSGTNVISSANLDGSGGTDFKFTAVNSPSGTAIDAVAGVIYWANSAGGTGGNGTISSARLNGQGATLSTGDATVNKPRGLAIDAAAGKLYWANSAGGAGEHGSISWADLSGTGGTDLISDAPAVNSPDGVTVDPADGVIYWANSAGGSGPNPGSIMSAKLDGSGVAPLTPTGATVDSPAGLALDPETSTLYWANSPAGGPGSISYWDLATGSGGDLTAVAPVDHPEGISIDPVAGRLYWTNTAGGPGGTGSISWQALDGSSGGTLATTGATTKAPAFPVLLVAPAGTGAPRITGAATPGSTLTCQKASWAGDVLPAFYYRAARNITWQWSRDGTDITGATTTSYTATAVGSYTCREMAKNHAGTTRQTSDPFVVSAQPLVTGTETSSVTATGAVLGGTIVPQYAATTYHFDYGITSGYGSRVPATDAAVGSDGAGHAVAQALSGLQPNRTYHFRLVATNANGTSYGADQSFTTTASPSVATGTATSLSTTGAVLEGSVNPRNLATGYYFEYGPTTAYGGRVPAGNVSVGSDDAGHAVSQAVSGLAPDTTYHFRLVVVNATGTSYGADATFRTLAQSLARVAGRVGTIGASLRLTLACTGVAGQHCQATVSVRVIEKLSANGRRILGVSSTRARGRSRMVVVARRDVDLASGARKDVALRLNATGRRLRSRFNKLPAMVQVARTITGRTQTIRTSRVTFGADPPKVRIIKTAPAGSHALTIRLHCGGSTGQRCVGVLELTTFERLAGDGRTIAGLTREPAGLGKLVTIGRARCGIPARSTSRCTVRLTAAGGNLLSRFGRIPARLTIALTENGYSVKAASTKVSFRR